MTETSTPEAFEYTDRDLPRLYVAGPMAGLPDYNYPAFDGAAALLAERGYPVENPAENEQLFKDRVGPPHYTEYLRAGLAQLLRCDGVATLEGWWNSGGARWEVQTAGILGLEVRPVSEWLAMAHDPEAPPECSCGTDTPGVAHRLAAPCYHESPGPKAVPQCRIDGCTATAPHGHTTSNHPEEWWCPPSEWLDDANRGIVLPNDQPTRVLPTEAEVARVIFGAQERDWRSWAHTQQEPYLKAARAVLALFASQPTVAQVKAEAQGATYDTAFVRRCATDEAYSGELLSARESDSWLARVKADAWDESSKATSEAIFSSRDARGVCISWVIPTNPYREIEG